MSELLALGISHRTAPLSVRERIALPEGMVEPLLRDLVAQSEISEAVAISTCNRTELYLVVSDPVEAESELLGRLSRRAGIRPTELVDAIYAHRNCDAARHLFRVAAGLDSMIVGEAEIQGQVKRAYEEALGAGTTGPLTNQLFRAALATGKRARSETAIGEGAASIPSEAVDVARAQLGDLADRRVLIVGAGETGELTAKALAAHGVATLFVANRRADRARALATRYGGGAIGFDRLPDELVRADIVVSSTAAPHTLIEAEDLQPLLPAREGRPLLLLDLAVPRDIDQDCGLLDGVTLYDVDALHAQVAANRSGREAEARRAEAIVEEEITTFAGWLGSLEVLPTIGALRRHAAEIVATVLAENEGRWGDGMDERDRERVEALARAVANRLLHEPTLRVKRSSGATRHARMQLLRELFGLEEDAMPASDAAEVRELPARRQAS